MAYSSGAEGLRWPITKNMYGPLFFFAIVFSSTQFLHQKRRLVNVFYKKTRELW